MEGTNEAAEGVKGPDRDEVDEGRVRKLVAALRSGKYGQGHGFLQRAGSYCCLGVACEVAIANGRPLDVKPTGGTGGVMYYADPDHFSDRSDMTLPQVVMGWFGWGGPNPWVYIPAHLAQEHEVGVNAETLVDWSESERYRLTVLNDDFHFSFDEIADCIEYTYLPQDWEAGRGQDHRRP